MHIPLQNEFLNISHGNLHTPSHAPSNIVLTQELCQPDGLVVMLHRHRARIEEHQDDHEPEPGGGLAPLPDQEPHLLLLAPELLVEVHLGAALLGDHAVTLHGLLLRKTHFLQ